MSPPAPATTSEWFDPRLRGFRDRAEVQDVVRLLDERVRPLPAEVVPVPQAAGRVLTESVVSEVAVPGFDRAAMDGYAVRAEETFGAGPYNPLELRVVGVSLPARPFAGTVAPGQAVRIMTGAPLPDGADAVLPVEVAQEEAGALRVAEAVSPGRHVGRRGEDIAPGRAVLFAGRVLRPQDLGLLASLGMATVSVVRRPRVALLVTGDELLPVGSRPEGYRIVDSNSVMLAALVRRDGGEPGAAAMVPDRRDAVRAALQGATADLLLVSGGSSVGQEDHAPAIVAELGELPVHGVALRPASPTGVGFLNDRPVFLLPGNPVSCLCAYDLFAGRALRRLGGRCLELPYRPVALPLAAKISSAVGRVDYVRVRVRDGQAEPLAVSGASLLSTTTAADGFVLVPRDAEGYPPGEVVTVYLYDGQP
jgi:molybdopterin molybdotransferase